jgi:hypothetical protein
MRKTLATIAAVALVLFATSAMAAGFKPPKELCLELDGSPNSVFCLAVKSLGSVKFAENQKLQHYTIAGTYSMSGQHFPIGGTGYIDGPFFFFHISGQYQYGNAVFRSAEGYINLMLESPTGSVTEVYSSAGNPVTQNTSSLAQVPCSGVSAPDGL